MAFDILFETDRFNVSKVEDYFINPCCFGDDLALWLGKKLSAHGVTTSSPGQEDWGWYLFVEQGPDRYLLGMTGYHSDSAVGINDGEWRIMLQKKRSLWDKIRGRNTTSDTDLILLTIERILREESGVRNIRREPR